MSEEIQSKTTLKQEIDFIEIIKIVWGNRKKIIRIALYFLLFGLFVAVFSVKEYSSSITMVISENKNKVGGLSGIAAMAGINIGSLNEENGIALSTYPTILCSTPFIKELMQSKVKFKKFKEPITLYEYFSDDKNQPFNLVGKIRTYTLGLPGVIIDKLKKTPDYGSTPDSSKSGYLTLSLVEYNVSRTLYNKVTLETKEDEGMVIITANMPEAEAAAQVVQTVKDLLQKYIIKFKIEKVQQNLDFIYKQYLISKNKFESKQTELAQFRDANQNVISSLTRTHEEKLVSEYNLYFNVYSELAKQLEQAKIKLNETQPVLTVIDPPLVPYKKSKPNRPAILFFYLFFGVIVGISVTFIPIIKTKIGFDKNK